MPLKFPPPLSKRQFRECGMCIGADDECYATTCWIDNEFGENRYDFTGKNLKPCKYHITSEEYKDLMDSIIEEVG